jgi:uncharacterized integral membrane protein
MRILVWLLRLAVFFVLFAFALNNQQDTVVRWFFGYQWQAPTVIVVLSAFAAGCVFTLAALLPRWRRHRLAAPAGGPGARPHKADDGRSPAAGSDRVDATAPTTLPPPVHPPREGL